MKIGELAKKAGCQAVTIRFYEKEGLLPQPERSGKGYRLYGQADLERLNFIRHCRHHDMQLAEIRDLLAFMDNPVSDCMWINQLVEARIASVDAQIASLLHLKSHLQDLLSQCGGDKHSECGILQRLRQAENCPFCESAPCPALQATRTDTAQDSE